MRPCTTTQGMWPVTYVSFACASVRVPSSSSSSSARAAASADNSAASPSNCAQRPGRHTSCTSRTRAMSHTPPRKPTRSSAMPGNEPFCDHQTRTARGEFTVAPLPRSRRTQTTHLGMEAVRGPDHQVPVPTAPVTATSCCEPEASSVRRVAAAASAPLERVHFSVLPHLRGQVALLGSVGGHLLSKAPIPVAR